MHDTLTHEAELGARRRAWLADLVRGGLPGEARGRHPVRRPRHDTPRQAPSHPRSDAELRERVQQRLGCLVSHPRAIAVDVVGGVVRLTGRVLRQEREGLVHQVRSMPGVRQVMDALSAHPDPRAISRPAAAPVA